MLSLSACLELDIIKININNITIIVIILLGEWLRGKGGKGGGERRISCSTPTSPIHDFLIGLHIMVESGEKKGPINLPIPPV